MSHPVYTVPAGDVLPIFFDTFDGGTGASATLTGLAVTDIEIYKDGGATQRASDAGYTLLDTDGIDFDGITGIHGFSIDTGDNTDAGFYTVGAWFHVVVSSVTIDGQTVNFVAAAFRIMAAEAIAGKPKVDVDGWLGTAASTPTVAGVPNVNVKTWNDLTTVALPLIPTTAGRTLDVSAGGEAGLDWANIGSPTTVQNLSGTNIDVDQVVASVSGAVGSVTGAVGSVTGAVGSVAAGVTLAANAITAAATAADFTTEIQSGLATAAALDTVDNLLDTEIAALQSDMTAIKAKTDNLPASPAAVGSAMTLTSAYDFAKGTTAVTEAYAANGAAPTPVQALMAIHQMLMQFAISGTNLTVKKLDNSTTAFVVTLDSATAPTSAVRT